MRGKIRLVCHRESWSTPLGRLALCVILVFSVSLVSSAQNYPAHPDWPGIGQLFVGTCYQPIDRSPEQIDRDIAIMKHAGFNVVRMGDLSWDSFEPSQGKFSFDWFDNIMDKMHAAGIRVILDIPGTPAPIWLHRAYPGIDIVSQNGTRLPPAERYMDDISDPDYVREGGILADALTKRYAHHPAMIAVGYDNEIGNGFMSYSEANQQRFIAWLKKKYGTIENLNKVWATQRWSRRLNRFEDVDWPLADGPGPSERYLDLHRYWSDVTVARLQELEGIRRRNMPEIPSISNLWDTASRKGFDYLGTYKSYVSCGAEGFYPSGPVSGAFGTLIRDDSQAQLKTAVDEIGFRYIRFHAIFHDVLGTVRMENGKTSYDWTKLDQLYDDLLERHIKPFVELGFTPNAMKTSDNKIFDWQGNTSHPLSPAWRGLVDAFRRGGLARHGLQNAIVIFERAEGIPEWK
jgi:hypothetical protein